MQSVKPARKSLIWGVATLAIATAVSVVAVLLYISPPGQKMVSFYTDDAASIRPGDEVRIAGITVGKVKDLTMEPNHVKVRARVNSSTIVGNRSEIQVRMLTVVGGYYVNLVPLGSTPLGDTAIPLDRVMMPYSLIRTLNDATKITANVDPKPINESLNQIEAGLKGTNEDSLNAVIDAGNTLMSTIDRQRGQVTTMLNLTDEYIESLADFRETLKELVGKVSILQQTLALYSEGFGEAIKGISDIISALVPVGIFYDRHRDQFIEKAREFLHKSTLWIERNGVTVRVLRRIRDHIERVLDAQDARPEFLATDVCIPIPGSGC